MKLKVIVKAMKQSYIHRTKRCKYCATGLVHDPYWLMDDGCLVPMGLDMCDSCGWEETMQYHMDDILGVN